MLLLESSSSFLLEDGISKLTEETPANPGVVDLQNADAILLENGNRLSKEASSSPSIVARDGVAAGTSAVSGVGAAIKAATASTTGVGTATGLAPGAVRFDSAADLLTMPSSAVPASTGAWTIAGWVSIEVDRNAVTSFWSLDAIFSSNWHSLRTTSDGTGLRFNSGGTEVVTGPNLTVGKWYFLAARKTAADAMKVYVGDEAGGTLATYTGTAGAITSYAADGYVGGDPYNQFHDGRQWGLRVWNAELSDAEVEAEYKATTAVRTTNLLAQWLLDNATTPGTDSSGNGRTLTNSGGSYTLGSAPSVPAASGVSASTASSIGTGVASAVGAATSASTASSSGVGAATAVGASTRASTASASGVGTSTGVGARILAATASSSGVGAATAVGAATTSSTATATGAGVASGVGSTGGSVVSATASSSGVGAASGVGVTIKVATASASGTGLATGAGASTVSSTATSAGVGVASGSAASTFSATATSAGVGTPTGVGASTVSSTATSAGVGSASAASQTIVLGVGSSVGSSTASGVGEAVATVYTYARPGPGSSVLVLTGTRTVTVRTGQSAAVLSGSPSSVSVSTNPSSVRFT